MVVEQWMVVIQEPFHICSCVTIYRNPLQSHFRRPSGREQARSTLEQGRMLQNVPLLIHVNLPRWLMVLIEAGWSSDQVTFQRGRFKNLRHLFSFLPRWQEPGDPTKEKRAWQQVASLAYRTAALSHRRGRSVLSDKERPQRKDCWWQVTVTPRNHLLRMVLLRMDTLLSLQKTRPLSLRKIWQMLHQGCWGREPCPVPWWCEERSSAWETRATPGGLVALDMSFSLLGVLLSNSGSWWWTARPGMLQSIGSQRVGHDWVTELNFLCLSHKGSLKTFPLYQSCLHLGQTLLCLFSWVFHKPQVPPALPTSESYS